jgi:hypothetical protein
MSPKLIFKLDGSGAGISLLLALVMLLPLNHLFGFAPIYLGCLIVYAVFLLAYDIFCWRTVDIQWKPKMKVLIALNTSFMLAGVAVLLNQKYRPDVLGVIYLLGELFIVLVLIVIQVKSLKEK